MLGVCKMDKRFMVVEKMSSGGYLPLSRSYIHVYDHNIQTSSLKANQSQTLSGALLGKGSENSYNGPGHITKMAVMAINSKIRPKSSSSELEDL